MAMTFRPVSMNEGEHGGHTDPPVSPPVSFLPFMHDLLATIEETKEKAILNFPNHHSHAFSAPNYNLWSGQAHKIKDKPQTGRRHLHCV